MNPIEKKALIVDRNNNWLVQLKALMLEKSCSVAVGCMHLADKEGLIQQLRSTGYTVEPVVF